MVQIAIIADDLTGAADSAGAFAQSGLSTLVLLRDEVATEADVISLSTNSRDRTVEDAIAGVERAATKLVARHRGAKPPLIYKKMDSALRGHPAAELLATMRATGINRAIVAPALPDERRTTIDGHQYCDGIVLEQTVFGHGLKSSDLVEMFQAGASDPVSLVRSSDLQRKGIAAFSQTGIVIADAATNADLELLAASAIEAGIGLLCGSAGLARAVARMGGLTSQTAMPVGAISRQGPVLLIVGSQHQATAHQIEHARQHGVLVLRPEQHDLDEACGTLDAVISAAEIALLAGRHLIVTTLGLRNSPLGSDVVADRLSTVVDSEIVRREAGGMVLTGGDAAAAVCARLGSTSIWLAGEIQPAIPAGWFADGSMRGTRVVTKAGSFGTPDTLLSCIEYLTGNGRCG